MSAARPLRRRSLPQGHSAAPSGPGGPTRSVWGAGISASLTQRLDAFKGWLGAHRDGKGELPVRAHVDLGGARAVRLRSFDQALVGVVIALVALGLVMVYSASIAMPDNPKFANYSDRKSVV